MPTRAELDQIERSLARVYDDDSIPDIVLLHQSLAVCTLLTAPEFY